jgi:NADH dehydrogenase [ubiquinone] 1 alpha subcomplex assembly factor 7
LKQLKQFSDIKPTIHFVEASPFLRKTQASTLAPNQPVVSIEKPNASSVSTPSNNLGDIFNEFEKEGNNTQTVLTEDGWKIQWHDALSQVPRGVPTFLVAHEFFDAMPIYLFEVGILQ